MGTIKTKAQKKIALVAHDNCKDELLEWVRDHEGALRGHSLYATGTTGYFLQESTDLKVERFVSGPLGGDQQIGAAIVEGQIDILVFFWDPLAAQPHEPDVRALLRIAVLYNVAVACNRTTADFLVAAHLFSEEYNRDVVDVGDLPKRVYA